MSVKTYYHVHISTEGYQLLTSTYKELGAITTLKNIETIIKFHLPYIPRPNDSFSKLSDRARELSLTKIAYIIRDNYLNRGLSSQGAMTVKAMCIAIEKLIPNLQENQAVVNTDVIHHFFKFLNLKELALCSFVNKKWNQVSQENSLWEKFYLKYLPPYKLTHCSPGFWKSKLISYFNNLKDELYTENIFYKGDLSSFKMFNGIFVGEVEKTFKIWSIDDTNQLCQSNPIHCSTLLNIFQIHLQLDNPEEAQKCLRELHLISNKERYWIELTFLLEKKGNKIQKLGQIYRLLKKQSTPYLEEAIDRIYRCYAEATDLFDKMKIHFKKAIKVIHH